MFRGTDLPAPPERRELGQVAVCRPAGLSRAEFSKLEAIEMLLKLANSRTLPVTRFIYNVGLLHE
jgi:hypothetical protein